MSQAHADNYYSASLADGRSVGRFRPLDALGVVTHAVASRDAVDVQRVKVDRSAVAADLAPLVGYEQAAWCRQVHGGDVLAVDRPGLVGDGDALVSDVVGLGLVCLSADCPLVLLAEPNRRVVGIAHASWRSTVAGVTGRTVRLLADRYGADPGRMVACICPSAGPRRYEVGPEVREAMLSAMGPDAQDFFRRGAGDRWLCNLWAANIFQLAAAGVRLDRIHLAGICTITRNDMFPSHRAEGHPAGRFLAVIARTR